MVKRIFGTIETENQGAFLGAILRDPGSFMPVFGIANKALVQYVNGSALSCRFGGWTGQRGGGHFGG